MENMGIFDASEVPGTVYHLKPTISTDWISRVDRTIKGSYFKLSPMDPSDSVSDEFYPQAREIQRASLVVASLVSSKKLKWEQHNANVALLIGFAVGLGKQVLVLQEQPLATILDLGTVARPVETETQAGQIVEAWLGGHTQVLVSQRADSHKKARNRQQIERIRKIYLGHPDALQDSRLLDYFIPTKEFEDAIRGRRMIFIGRRGSGKSANFQAIKEELTERKGALTTAIAPDDFELERISQFLEQAYSLVNQKLVFQSTWHYVLLSEILKALAENGDRLYESPNDKIATSLRQYYETYQDRLALDFGSRVVTVLTDAVAGKPLGGGNPADTQEVIKSLRDYQIARRLKEFAIREKISYFIIADDLDKHWRPDSRQSIDLLIGLITEADRLQRFFEGRLKVVMFLREDIYDVLARYDDDLPKRSVLRMEWTQTNLRHLIAERLAIAADEFNEEDEATWSVIFPHDVNGQRASDYILSRTLPKPRDVLDFCQKAIDQAQRNGHDAVTQEDILDGEASFSEGVFWSVGTEFRGIYPGLEDVIFEFAGVTETMPWTKFEKLASKAIKLHEASISRWIGNDVTDPESLGSILFRVGVIGLSTGAGPTPFFANGRTFAETWNLVTPQPTVHIHPAFVKFLDIAKVDFQHTRRRRKQQDADPRQLRLGDTL